MSIVAHLDIELSFYNFINTNYAGVYGYAVNYGGVKYSPIDTDLWASVLFIQPNAGLKMPSTCKIDIITRLHDDGTFYGDESEAVGRLVNVLTNARVPLYSYADRQNPVLVPSNVILVKNDDGRLTVTRVQRGIPLEESLHGSSIFFNVELLTDNAGGRVI